ncbi:hypothetical protein GXW82_15385 [Streptacidiphilus sp. 4-A2]|nr:hypothetical protein [Streptacidiphilus sp. 4-A2]
MTGGYGITGGSGPAEVRSETGTKVATAAGAVTANAAEPFPLELWSETVHSRRSIPDTLATGGYAAGRPDPDPYDGPSAALPGGRGLPLPPPPLQLGPLPPGPVGPAALAALLHYSFGLLQHDLTPGGWPLHRAVASARCLYPSELYLLPSRTGARQRPGQVYRFDPLHHQLLPLRPAVAGGDHQPDGPSGVLVITSRFARTARLYGGYAPRLCAQEAGMLLGAVQLTAAALGLPVRAGLGRQTLLALCDGWVEAGAEHPMACLKIGPHTAGPDAPAADAPGPDAPGAAQPARQSWRPRDLAGALRARHSGAAIFDPDPRPAPAELLDELVDALTDAPFPDFSCHLLVNRVAGMRPGHYLCTNGGLRLLRPGDPLPALERIGQTEGRVSMNFRACAFTAYLAVRREAAVAAYGADAFRRLHLAAGAAAHRICVAAAAHRHSARVHNGYDAAAAERSLGLTGSGQTVLFQIAVGAARPSAAFRLPVVF